MSQPSAHPAQAVLDELAGRLDAAFGDVVREGDRIALVDFPNHNNSGDSAIWLGELAFLRRRGIRIDYICDDSTYSPHDLDRTVPQGPIYLHGGGNFGDLWPQHQALRERVLADHPGRTVVQFPQTVAVQDPGTLPRLALLARTRTGRFVVHGRDAASVSLLAAAGLDARLTPDMAFALGACPRRAAAEHDVVVIRRLDHERTRAEVLLPAHLSVHTTDWLDTSGAPWRRRLSVRSREASRSMATRIQSANAVGRAVRRIPLIASEHLARVRTDTAMKQLSSGRVVVTDRLHGHILSLLMGQPHVLIDDRHGKIRRFHEAFTAGSSLTTMVSQPGEVAAEVERALRGTAP